MMAKKKLFLGFITKEPKEWFHYVLLFFALCLALIINNTFFAEVSYIFTILWFFLVLSLSDQLIHKILKIK